MSVQHRLTGSKIGVDVLCGAWIVALGSALVWWNLQAGYTTRAQVVGVLMTLGAIIYLGDIASTLYRGDRDADGAADGSRG
jgi:hypothetical protein